MAPTSCSHHLTKSGGTLDNCIILIPDSNLWKEMDQPRLFPQCIKTALACTQWRHKDPIIATYPPNRRAWSKMQLKKNKSWSLPPTPFTFDIKAQNNATSDRGICSIGTVIVGRQRANGAMEGVK